MTRLITYIIIFFASQTLIAQNTMLKVAKDFVKAKTGINVFFHMEKEMDNCMLIKNDV